jgi:hypothetical protein
MARVKAEEPAFGPAKNVRHLEPLAAVDGPRLSLEQAKRPSGHLVAAVEVLDLRTTPQYALVIEVRE